MNIFFDKLLIFKDAPHPPSNLICTLALYTAALSLTVPIQTPAHRSPPASLSWIHRSSIQERL